MTGRLEDRYAAITVETIRSNGGVFEVAVDGKTVFSKKETGRFPSDDEVIAAVGAEL